MSFGPIFCASLTLLLLKSKVEGFVELPENESTTLPSVPSSTKALTVYKFPDNIFQFDYNHYKTEAEICRNTCNTAQAYAAGEYCWRSGAFIKRSFGWKVNYCTHYLAFISCFKFLYKFLENKLKVLKSQFLCSKFPL